MEEFIQDDPMFTASIRVLDETLLAIRVEMYSGIDCLP
jgi:hypothetical protein